MAKLNVRNIYTPQKTRDVTDNYRRLMGRVTYGIANSSESAAGLDYFYEEQTWVPGQEGKRGINHTVEREKATGKVKDYGDWSVTISSKSEYLLRPKISILGANIPLPMRVPYQMLNFPETDTGEGFWTVFAQPMGNPLLFLFAFTPHVSDEAYQAESERLGAENGIDLAQIPLYRVQWSPDYKLGDAGEKLINTAVMPDLKVK